jgi:hypothetical protein
VGGHLGRGVLAGVDGVGHLGAPVECGAAAGGSRVRIKQPRLPATVWTVSDLVEGKQFTWTADNPGVRTRASHRVVGRADGSQATLRIDQGGVLGSVVGFLYGGPHPALSADGGCRPQAALRGVHSAAPGLSRSDPYAGALAADGR